MNYAMLNCNFVSLSKISMRSALPNYSGYLPFLSYPIWPQVR